VLEHEAQPAPFGVFAQRDHVEETTPARKVGGVPNASVRCYDDPRTART
jgi:hypothetical protein